MRNKVATIFSPLWVDTVISRGSLSVNSFFFWRHQCKYQFVSDGASQPEISFLYVRVAWEILRRVYWLLGFACLSKYSKTTNCYVFLAWNVFRFTAEWIIVTVFASSIYESLGDSITVWHQKKGFLQFRIFAIQFQCWSLNISLVLDTGISREMNMNIVDML